jgi:hypothetical protein
MAASIQNRECWIHCYDFSNTMNAVHFPGQKRNRLYALTSPDGRGKFIAAANGWLEEDASPIKTAWYPCPRSLRTAENLTSFR